MYDQTILLSLVALAATSFTYSAPDANFDSPSAGFQMSGLNSAPIESGQDDPIDDAYQYPKFYSSDSYSSPDDTYHPYIPLNNSYPSNGSNRHNASRQLYLQKNVSSPLNSNSSSQANTNGHFHRVLKNASQENPVEVNQ